MPKNNLLLSKSVKNVCLFHLESGLSGTHVRFFESHDGCHSSDIVVFTLLNALRLA